MIVKYSCYVGFVYSKYSSCCIVDHFCSLFAAAAFTYGSCLVVLRSMSAAEVACVAHLFCSLFICGW